MSAEPLHPSRTGEGGDAFQDSAAGKDCEKMMETSNDETQFIWLYIAI